MKFLLLLTATMAEPFWVPHNAIGIAIIAATATFSMAMILRGKA